MFLNNKIHLIIFTIGDYFSPNEPILRSGDPSTQETGITFLRFRNNCGHSLKTIFVKT